MVEYTAEEKIQAEELYRSMYCRAHYMGFKERELSAAFNAVSDPQDWKAPIKVMVSAADLPVVQAAIVFYTATSVTVTPITRGRDTLYQVESVGYRMGPAGDH